MSESKSLKDYISDKHLTYLLSFVGILLIFKIVFYKEDVATIFRFVGSFLILFTLPGAMIVSLLGKGISNLEKILFGSFLGAALILLISYYTNQMGVSMKYSNYVFAVYLISISLVWYYKSKKKDPYFNR